MGDKLYDYIGFGGWLHGVRDNIRDKWLSWKEEHPDGVLSYIRSCYREEKPPSGVLSKDFSDLYRSKTRRELVRLSAAVMGIEFSYAAETAFVSPTLLKIGVEHKHMTLVWALSPLIGFFLTPILGSLSDRCPLKFGRRRPFIFFMSLGVLIGLILVPNGEHLGYIMGDIKPPVLNHANNDDVSKIIRDVNTETSNFNTTKLFEEEPDSSFKYENSHPWGVFFTILGTVLLDFDADACQSPARAYLLDVTITEDHARGLSTFTIMAGLGGFFGYALGGINWDVTAIGVMLGGHVKAVFTLISIIFVVCVTYTLTSFKEMPLNLLELYKEEDIVQLYKSPNRNSEDRSDKEDRTINVHKDQTYGTLTDDEIDSNGEHIDIENRKAEYDSKKKRISIAPPPNASFFIYLKSIIYMPYSIRILCLTNLFCWMAHVCYSLYFTDFVGEAVYNGNPTAPEDDPDRILYESGVRFGCWGMSMYSLSCACYSMIIERLIHKLGAKRVYVGGLLVYGIGMLLMALTKHRVGVLLFSWTAGVMYSTLFTMPYLLIAHYHSKGVFEISDNGQEKLGNQIRGLGTDVAIVSSMVFLAQFILSVCMGSIVSISGTTTAVVSVASGLSFCGAIAATQIMYLEM